MRLQLDAETIEEISRRCGAATADVGEDVRAILTAFRQIDHDPFTRKDVTSILLAMGMTQSVRGTTVDWNQGNTWFHIGDTIRDQATQVTGRRGYWAHHPLPTPKPQPAAPPSRPSRQPQKPQPSQPSQRDDRDSQTWVVYELTSSGERAASEGLLEEHLKSILKTPSLEVFVPYLSYCYEERMALFNVMEGYAFAEYSLDDRLYLAVVHESPYLKGVLHSKSGGSLVLHTVPDQKVCELRDSLAEMVAVEIQIGMEVEITRGICQGLTGSVVGLEEDVAHVLITLRTLRSIRTLPRLALLPVGDDHE